MRHSGRLVPLPETMQQIALQMFKKVTPIKIAMGQVLLGPLRVDE
jgi:hypothetical protein